MSDEGVVTLVIKPLIPPQQEPLVQATLDACREASRDAFPIAKRFGTKTMTRVMGVATVSLAALPPELAKGVAESVAHEVATNGHDGTKGSCRLTWGGLVLRKNLRLRLMTITGDRLSVDVRERDKAALAGKRLVMPAYLMPDPSGGFLLRVGVVRAESPEDASVKSSAPTMVTRDAAVAVQPDNGLVPHCTTCESDRVHMQGDPPYEDDWFCDECLTFVEVRFLPPRTQQSLEDFMSEVRLPPSKCP